MSDSNDGARELSRLRDEIERIDRSIVNLIAERVRVARTIGSAKRAAGLPTLDPAREALIIRRSGTLAREAGLSLGEEDVREIFWHLVGLCRRAQIEPVTQGNQ